MLRYTGKKLAVAAATARLAGLTKFGRPRKTQAFFGAPELRPRAGVRRKAPLPAYFNTSMFSARSLGARRASKLNIQKFITGTPDSINLIEKLKI
jgi:hypothetical protein